MQSMSPVKQYNRILLKCLLALVLAFVSLASVAQNNDRIDLPDLGNSAENFLSDSEEEEYARAILMQMRAYEVLVDDPLIAGYFSDMGFRLVSHSSKPTKPFTFVVLDEPRVNAFAAPGGVVALHSGLILEADDEHEVAGVLAHEVAHITQLHLYRTLENAKSMTIPIALGMLALVLAGGGGGEAIAGAMMGGNAMSQQMMINFTRDNESEADRIGIKTLSLAGYDPIGMADFFEKMGRISRLQGEGPPEFLRTHPVSVNRVAEAKNRAANMPAVEAGDGLNFYLVQARLRALVEKKPGDAVVWFRDQLDDTHSEAKTRGYQYGLAIALQRQHEYDEVRTILERLLDKDPYRLDYLLQMADLDLMTERSDEALGVLSELHSNFPGNHAIAVTYSDALLRDKDPEQARAAGEILRKQLISHDDDPMLYELYAKAASIAGEEARSSLALAESYFRRGGVSEAIEQLEMLENRDDLDYYQRAKVSARLEEMRIFVADFDDLDDDN